MFRSNHTICEIKLHVIEEKLRQTCAGVLGMFIFKALFQLNQIFANTENNFSNSALRFH